MAADNKLPRREREKLRQRQEILATALDLFSQKGYHNVSVQEIAEKSEFAIGTLYKFFQNKEDLYKALVRELCDKFEDSIMRAIEQPQDEVEKLRSYVRAKTEVFHRNLPFIRLYLAESRGASFNLKAGLDDELRKRYYNSLESIADIFASGIKNQRFKNIADPYYLAVTLSSVIDAFLLLWLDAPERHPYPEDPDAILDIFFKGLLEP
ncbi:TetR/AcrR family transcriptional regulator [Desulfobacca acetoxidans]|uniref:Transcriptional regulator, TetR family n=1 Tax=Desulfobacca acetoxidans (strain ATCC 700848 / DSM 11109 / ASRB2) TaxID=880072 RepID=F2NCV3_DESAR|nr:TetR/AcrR family transcriptional regulator [Desulfobacca acetoxidans]AEB09384.1 transcriptional regulator, TetR family [Desulfobacca acetoxidans DSM 11109]HAY20801.1 TetR/AcrR family transcriptional regulator [Desulfobacterales bacterium]